MQKFTFPKFLIPFSFFVGALLGSVYWSIDSQNFVFIPYGFLVIGLPLFFFEVVLYMHYNWEFFKKYHWFLVFPSVWHTNARFTIYLGFGILLFVIIIFFPQLIPSFILAFLFFIGTDKWYRI